VNQSKFTRLCLCSSTSLDHRPWSISVCYVCQFDFLLKIIYCSNLASENGNTRWPHCVVSWAVYGRFYFLWRRCPWLQLSTSSVQRPNCSSVFTNTCVFIRPSSDKAAPLLLSVTLGDIHLRNMGILKRPDRFISGDGSLDS